MVIAPRPAVFAAVATAAGRGPEVTGKPHRATASLLEARHGRIDVVVGARTLKVDVAGKLGTDEASLVAAARGMLTTDTRHKVAGRTLGDPATTPPHHVLSGHEF